MQINSHIHKENLMHKSQRDSAPLLHKLYDNDSAPFEIPTARELIIEKLTWFKWFEIEHEDFLHGVKFSEDAESQELCKLANVDWQDLDVSVIDEYFANKSERRLNGGILTFKDFRLQH